MSEPSGIKRSQIQYAWDKQPSVMGTRDVIATLSPYVIRTVHEQNLQDGMLNYIEQVEEEMAQALNHLLYGPVNQAIRIAIPKILQIVQRALSNQYVELQEVEDALNPILASTGFIEDRKGEHENDGSPRGD